MWDPRVILRKVIDAAPREVSPGADCEGAPLMVDIMHGPNAPLARALVTVQRKNGSSGQGAHRRTTRQIPEGRR